jgi:hypothetical protein
MGREGKSMNGHKHGFKGDGMVWCLRGVVLVD